ncbi:hypothetical protein ACE1CI_20610 [Aerosakkonemataceae cyanobacterium BLCC-F50]|uniref:Uncharacterized protein n=1 Tax=Floridaenema flaviceps BLCC-F50 TaxID=3153642 RepID=A0ABV4XUC3_9CYAN
MEFPTTVSSTGIASGELSKLNSQTIKNSMKQEENIEFTWVKP